MDWAKLIRSRQVHILKEQERVKKDCRPNRFFLTTQLMSKNDLFRPSADILLKSADLYWKSGDSSQPPPKLQDNPEIKRTFIPRDGLCQ